MHSSRQFILDRFDDLPARIVEDHAAVERRLVFLHLPDMNTMDLGHALDAAHRFDNCQQSLSGGLAGMSVRIGPPISLRAR